MIGRAVWLSEDLKESEGWMDFAERFLSDRNASREENAFHASLI